LTKGVFCAILRHSPSLLFWGISLFQRVERLEPPACKEGLMTTNTSSFLRPDGNLKSIGEFMAENYPGFNPALSLSPGSVEVLKDMAALFDVSKNWVPYGRYGGDPISNAVAELYTHRMGARQFSYAGRLTNSGMASITIALLALRDLGKPLHIVASTPLYGLTPDTLRRFADKCEVTEVADGNIDQMVDALKKGSSSSTKVLFVETIGNGVPMPTVDLRELFTQLWDEEVYVVVDNTFATPHLTNPFGIMRDILEELQEIPRCMPVYVESLSKYFRCRTSEAPGDHATAGYVAMPVHLVEKMDFWLDRSFTIQWPALREFPVDLYEASKVTLGLSAVTHYAAWLLRRSDVIIEVYYPDDKDLFPKGAGGVFYIKLDTEDPDYPDSVFDGVFEEVGSFGHDHTTIINFGRYGAPVGTVRIAVGVNETQQSITALLRQCFPSI